MLCTKSNRSPQIRNVFNQNLFILLLTCFNIFRMKVFLACKHLVVFYLSLKVAINFSCLRNFLEPIFLTFSCGPRLLRSVTSYFHSFGPSTCATPNTQQLSPGMTILDQLTANLTAKTRIFDLNFDFYDTPDAILKYCCALSRSRDQAKT